MLLNMFLFSHMSYHLAFDTFLFALLFVLQALARMLLVKNAFPDHSSLSSHYSGPLVTLYHISMICYSFWHLCLIWCYHIYLFYLFIILSFFLIKMFMSWEQNLYTLFTLGSQNLQQFLPWSIIFCVRYYPRC